MPFSLYRTILEYRDSAVGSELQAALERGMGILALHPAWGPRLFCDPGRNLELVCKDYRPEGVSGPGIDERWLAMPFVPDTGVEKHFPIMARMGMSHIYSGDGKGIIPLDAAIDAWPEGMVGALRWKYNRGPGFWDKYFDNGQSPKYPSHVGDLGHHHHPLKREGYSFHALRNKRYNNNRSTSVGLLPSASYDFIRRGLLDWDLRDNEIRLHACHVPVVMGTGAQMDRGILHGPAAVATHEAQGPGPAGVLSDDFRFLQNRIGGADGQPLEMALLLRHTPEDLSVVQRIDFVLNTLDLERQYAFDPRCYVQLPVPIARYRDQPQFVEADWTLYGLNTREQCFSHQWFRLKAGTAGRLWLPTYAAVHVLQGAGTIGGNRCRGVDNQSIEIGTRIDDEFIVPHQTAIASQKDGGIVLTADPTGDLVLTIATGPDAWSRDEYPLPPWQQWSQALPLRTS